MNEPVTLHLSADQALVLFEFLSRHEYPDRLETVDRAEEQVLSDIEAALERTVVAPFHPDYSELLEAARTRLRGSQPPGDRR